MVTASFRALHGADGKADEKWLLTIRRSGEFLLSVPAARWPRCLQDSDSPRAPAPDQRLRLWRSPYHRLYLQSKSPLPAWPRYASDTPAWDTDRAFLLAYHWQLPHRETAPEAPVLQSDRRIPPEALSTGI